MIKVFSDASECLPDLLFASDMQVRPDDEESVIGLKVHERIEILSDDCAVGSFDNVFDGMGSQDCLRWLDCTKRQA